MEVFAHLPGSNTLNFLGIEWQDPAIRVAADNADEDRLFRHFGEAVTERVDDELQAIRDFEL